MFDMYSLTKEFYSHVMGILPTVSRARTIDYDALREKLEAIGEHNTRTLSRIQKNIAFNETHEIGNRQTNLQIGHKTANYYNTIKLSVYQKRDVGERVSHEFLKSRIGIEACRRPALSLSIVSRGTKCKQIGIRVTSLSGVKILIEYENDEITIRYLCRNPTLTEAVPVRAHIPAIQINSKDFETGKIGVTKEWQLPAEINESSEVIKIFNDYDGVSKLTRRMAFVKAYRESKENLAPVETKELWTALLNGY